jgi:hypothetical protein
VPLLAAARPATPLRLEGPIGLAGVRLGAPAGAVDLVVGALPVAGPAKRPFGSRTGAWPVDFLDSLVPAAANRPLDIRTAARAEPAADAVLAPDSASGFRAAESAVGLAVAGRGERPAVADLRPPGRASPTPPNLGWADESAVRAASSVTVAFTATEGFAAATAVAVDLATAVAGAESTAAVTPGGSGALAAAARESDSGVDPGLAAVRRPVTAFAAARDAAAARTAATFAAAVVPRSALLSGPAGTASCGTGGAAASTREAKGSERGAAGSSGARREVAVVWSRLVRSPAAVRGSAEPFVAFAIT